MSNLRRKSLVASDRRACRHSVASVQAARAPVRHSVNVYSDFQIGFSLVHALGKILVFGQDESSWRTLIKRKNSYRHKKIKVWKEYFKKSTKILWFALDLARFIRIPLRPEWIFLHQNEHFLFIEVYFFQEDSSWFEIIAILSVVLWLWTLFIVYENQPPYRLIAIIS